MPDGACLVDRIAPIGSRLRNRAWLRVVTVWLVVFLVTPPLIQADEIHLESIGLRGGGRGGGRRYRPSSVVYRGIGVRYWFHHLSDVTLYGDKGRGFDLHMIELSYRF